MKEIEGVHDNKPPSKQVEHVVDKGMNEDELVMDDNCISLKERPTKDVEGIHLHQILIWTKNLFHYKMRA
jgi:hypothetical protein